MIDIPDFDGTGCPSCGPEAIVVLQGREPVTPEGVMKRAYRVQCDECEKSWVMMFRFDGALIQAPDEGGPPD